MTDQILLRAAYCVLRIACQVLTRRYAIRSTHHAVRSAVLVLSACAPGPIVWDDPALFPRDSLPTIVPRDSTREVRARVDAWLQRDGLCGVVESILGPVRFRAGWHIEGQGLLVSRSADGGLSWDPPVVIDARGSRRHACRRPAIFADSINRYLHLSYFLDIESGGGVFYSHSMRADKLAAAGEGMFEPPRAVVYGDQWPAATSVASRGDTVAVAYEDPNSRRARIMLALSTTAGHSFAHRERVSPDAGEGRWPTVRLRPGEIEVIWRQPGSDTAHAVRRIGRFR